MIRLSGALRAARTACGLDLPPSHAHALAWLAQPSEAPRAQRDLARALGLDKSSVARLCQRMFEAGHIEMSRDRENARFVRLRLTPRGTRAARVVEHASLERHARLIEAIPIRDRRRVLDALDVLSRAMASIDLGGGA